jgi:hypothetical protein
MPDLVAGRVEQRAALAGVAIEVGEFLAVLALQQHRLAALRRPLGEATEPFVDIGEPVAFLGVFALVDDIEADLALPCHDGRDLRAQPLLIIWGVSVEPRGVRQASDMGGQNLVGAALHLDSSNVRQHQPLRIAIVHQSASHSGALPNLAAADLTRSARWATHADGEGEQRWSRSAIAFPS